MSTAAIDPPMELRKPPGLQDTELAETAGGFIHEIKNRLGTLRLNLQLLAEDFEQPKTPQERRALQRVDKLQAQCQSVLDISNDFLRFARITDLNLERSDLHQVIGHLVDFFAPTAMASNIDLKTFIPNDLPPVMIDQVFFKQAMLNLILNAQQSMPDGGEITLQASCEQLFDGSGENSITSEVVTLDVIDTGEGMSPEVLSRIFDVFYSTKEEGSGLGLPTTKRIIEAHGCSLRVESAPGRGTRFTIFFPV